MATFWCLITFGITFDAISASKTEAHFNFNLDFNFNTCMVTLQLLTVIIEVCYIISDTFKCTNSLLPSIEYILIIYVYHYFNSYFSSYHSCYFSDTIMFTRSQLLQLFGTPFHSTIKFIKAIFSLLLAVTITFTRSLGLHQLLPSITFGFTLCLLGVNYPNFVISINWQLT